MEKKNKLTTLDMVYTAMFACLMTICAWISIPGQVPFTLQTMGVFLAVGLLGGKRGTLAILVYVLMGAAPFHGAGAHCLLRLRHGLVPGGVYQGQGSHLSGSGAGNVCDTLHHPGHYQDCLCPGADKDFETVC